MLTRYVCLIFNKYISKYILFLMGFFPYGDKNKYAYNYSLFKE